VPPVYRQPRLDWALPEHALAEPNEGFHTPNLKLIHGVLGFSVVLLGTAAEAAKMEWEVTHPTRPATASRALL